LEDIIKDAILSNHFLIDKHRIEPRREEIVLGNDDLGLSQNSLDLLNRRGINLWSHQHEAIKQAKAGKNICVTTSTSSGKSEIFQISVLEALAQNPNGRVLAVYPMKALSRQQVDRWEKAVNGNYSVGKIDGDDQDYGSRAEILRTKNIVVMTPDVIHAYLLSNINNNRFGDIVRNFIQNISVIVIDELHLYKGVFGTNAAYVFRRLNNVRRLLRHDHTFPQYITASATLTNAVGHSSSVCGVGNFVEISNAQDGSPMAEKHYFFIERDNENAPKSTKGLVADLIRELSHIDNTKSITFVEGRQQTGELANQTELQENNNGQTAETDNESGEEAIQNAEIPDIYPFRAGYESEAIDVITEKLNQGNFKGVYSTSALEIGIDIDGLNIAVIADMPYDLNSYQQRIGRVGRYGCEQSFVIIVKDDRSFASKLLFEVYDYDITRVLPQTEPTLYLEDENVQNIHAMCHIGDHTACEYSRWKIDGIREQFDDGGCFPTSFVKRCNDIFAQQYDSRYERIIGECRDGIPQHIYSLRYFGEQFKIVAARANNNGEYIPVENINRNMIATEAYIGAVRDTMRHTATGVEKFRERITLVNNYEHQICARRELNTHVKTKSKRRKYVIPNFKSEFLYSAKQCGETVIYNLRITESQYVYGYYEQYGRNRVYYYYVGGFDVRRQETSKESRKKNKNRKKEKEKENNKDNTQEIRKIYHLPNLITTGTIFYHPFFNTRGVKTSDIAEIIYQLLVKRNVVDRNDLNYSAGVIFNGNDLFEVNDKFVAIYDINELNISRRLTDANLLTELFGYLRENLDIIVRSICPNINDLTRQAIRLLCDSILDNNISDEDDVNFGNNRIIQSFSPIIYLKDNPDDPDNFDEVPGIFGGYTNEGTTCTISVNGVNINGVTIDRIKPTDGTMYINN
jgi:DEAD/DEAH box helicase domain-containing protein